MAREYTEGIVDEVISNGSKLASELGAAIKERPYTTLAVAGGLAFAIGALWKLNQRPASSRYERLIAQMPEVPHAHDMQKWFRSQNLQGWLPRGWR
jgi:hypothetical protein